MFSVSQIQLRTYIGPEATFDGVKYRWYMDRYVLASALPTNIADGFNQSRKVTIPFKPFHKTIKDAIKPSDLNVYVDGTLWEDSSSVKKGTNVLTITFDEKFLLNQRNIRLVADSKYSTEYNYAIKARVYGQNDVVIIEFDKNGPIPVIGEESNPSNPTVSSLAQQLNQPQI